MKQAIHFPKWQELPQIDLYLDQVLAYVNQIMTQNLGQAETSLTAAMINNYVKQGYLPKPIKKKYNSLQLARLIVITSLKPVFAIQDIWTAIESLNWESEDLYNSFVTCMAEEKGEIPPLIQSACQTLKSYYLTRQILAELEKENPHESNR